MNKNLFTDQDENSIRISEFNEFLGETSFKHVAAKFVVRGKESYVINGKKFQVKQGEYIFGNNDQLSEVQISENTVGLCIDIANKLIQEILENTYENPDLKEFILTDKLLINKYNSEHTNLGHKLNQLTAKLIHGESKNLLTDELFYSIGENIVNDQALVFEQLSKLHYKKQVVNEEMFRNLMEAKTYIDDCFLDSLNLDDLIRVANLSKYAFIRQFKITFGVTPYQYMLHKRLMFAKNQLLKGEKIIDVAISTGFADSAAFSKAFKLYFGSTPSTVVK